MTVTVLSYNDFVEKKRREPQYQQYSKQRTRQCRSCAARYNVGDYHFCTDNRVVTPNGAVITREDYDMMRALVNENEDDATVWAKKPKPGPAELEWPLLSNNSNVHKYINELHELILDLQLRIEDLEEAQ